MVMAQQEVIDHGARKLGLGAEAAQLAVEGGAKLLEEGVAELARVQRVVAHGAHHGVLAQFGQDAFARGQNAFAIVHPGLRKMIQNRPKARPPVAILGRKVSAAEEGLQLRRQEYRHRPATRAAGGLDEHHVDAVNVGALFAVHLYGDEVLVQQAGNDVVLEALVLHHVAPMAGGVADGKEDGLVLGASFLEGLVAPGVPVHGIVGVLQKVGAGFVGESIRHSSHSMRHAANRLTPKHLIACPTRS